MKKTIVMLDGVAHVIDTETTPDTNRTGMDTDFTPFRTGFDEGIDIATLDITGNSQFM